MPLAEIINLLSGVPVFCGKIIDDNKVQDKISDCFQALIYGNFFEFFKSDMFIDECVAYYRTDKTFFIPDRVTEEIPLNRIAYFFQVINRLFCFFPTRDPVLLVLYTAKLPLTTNLCRSNRAYF
jgi:hypothetical protein